VRQQAYATCPTKQNASAPNTVAHTRCATGVRRRGATRFPVSEISRHSNGEPACASRCTGRTPCDRDRAARRIGEAKDVCEAALVQALAALRHSPKTWAAWLHQWRENPRELCSDSENWIQATLAGASVGFTKREAGVLRVTCIITRLSPWSRTGTIRSGWRSRAGFVKSATLRWAYIATPVLLDLNPSEDRAVRRCWGRRVKP
jgi:hypothetical protein